MSEEMRTSNDERHRGLFCGIPPPQRCAIEPAGRLPHASAVRRSDRVQEGNCANHPPAGRTLISADGVASRPDGCDGSGARPGRYCWLWWSWGPHQRLEQRAL